MQRADLRARELGFGKRGAASAAGPAAAPGPAAPGAVPFFAAAAAAAAAAALSRALRVTTVDHTGRSLYSGRSSFDRYRYVYSLRFVRRFWGSGRSVAAARMGAFAAWYRRAAARARGFRVDVRIIVVVRLVDVVVAERRRRPPRVRFAAARRVPAHLEVQVYGGQEVRVLLVVVVELEPHVAFVGERHHALDVVQVYVRERNVRARASSHAAVLRFVVGILQRPDERLGKPFAFHALRVVGPLVAAAAAAFLRRPRP